MVPLYYEFFSEPGVASIIVLSSLNVSLIISKSVDESFSMIARTAAMADFLIDLASRLEMTCRMIRRLLITMELSVDFKHSTITLISYSNYTSFKICSGAKIDFLIPIKQSFNPKLLRQQPILNLFFFLES